MTQQARDLINQWQKLGGCNKTIARGFAINDLSNRVKALEELRLRLIDEDDLTGGKIFFDEVSKYKNLKTEIENEQ